MKSTQQMQQEMEKRLKSLESKEAKLNQTINNLHIVRTKIQREIYKLTVAINALNDNPERPLSLDEKLRFIKESSEQAESGVPKEIRDALAQDPTNAEPAPPGFRWGKNSFGEDALIPDGLVLPPTLEEPITIAQPLKISSASPIVVPSAAFDRPEDLL